MKAKEFLQLFIPPIYYKVKQRLFPTKEPKVQPLVMRENKGERMIVIGNGPSLNKSMDLYSDVICASECIMVNYSACTPYFEQIKPAVYVVSDANLLPRVSDDSAQMKLIQTIALQTSWPMWIVLPSNFRNWWALDILRRNPFVSIQFGAAGWREMPDEQLFPAFDENRVTPPSYTVLTYCLYLAIYWGYPEVYLIGADTTFTQMVYVGQKDNLLYSVDTHFYNNNDVYQLELEPERHGRRYQGNMESYTEMCHYVFYEYNLLARYAKWKGVKVYNASEFSMIDCFERKKLK